MDAHLELSFIAERYKRLYRPDGVHVHWDAWESDQRRRLDSQRPIQSIGRMSVDSVLRTLGGLAEPAYQEAATTAFLADYMLSRGWRLDASSGSMRHQTHLVFGDPESSQAAIRCDLDAVSWGNGRFTHACGHDANMASMLTAADALREGPCASRVAFIFQPAEEGPGRVEDGYRHPRGLGGGQYLRSRGLFARTKILVSFHVDPSLDECHVRVTQGLATASGYRVLFEAEGGSCHAALPAQGRNPVDALREFLVRTALVNEQFRLLGSPDYGLVSITQTSTAPCDLNTLPSWARAGGISRIVGPAAWTTFTEYLSETHATAELEAPAVENDPGLAEMAESVASALNLAVVREPVRFRDESAWARYPAARSSDGETLPPGCERLLHFFVGTERSGGPLHSHQFVPSAASASNATAMLLGLVTRLCASSN